MFGFIIGTACLFGLVRVVRGPRGWRTTRHRRHLFLRRLFERLDTSPGQEKEIRDVARDLQRRGETLRDGLREARRDVAEAMRAEELDETTLGELLAKHDTQIDELRHSLVGALTRVHGTLDPEQREQLARWLGRGGPRRGFGPYRSWA